MCSVSPSPPAATLRAFCWSVHAAALLVFNAVLPLNFPENNLTGHVNMKTFLLDERSSVPRFGIADIMLDNFKIELELQFWHLLLHFDIYYSLVVYDATFSSTVQRKKGTELQCGCCYLFWSPAFHRGPMSSSLFPGSAPCQWPWESENWRTYEAWTAVVFVFHVSHIILVQN